MKNYLLTLFLSISILAGSLQAQNSNNVEQKIDSILSLLTLEEKVAMCHAQSKFTSPGVPRLGIPQIHMSDGPHGVRAEVDWDSWSPANWTNDSITAFPALTCLAASFNPQLALDYGKAVGAEARYRNKDILLGPGVNIYRTPLNGRNFEYMGEDPFLASIMVVPYIHGVQENGVAACVKHFALNNQEKWRNHINVELSDRALYEIYLPAFHAAVKEGKAWSFMSAYNQYQGQFCSHNEKLTKNILKEDWAFDGVLVSDWGAVHNTKEAALYGMDIEMGTGTDGLTHSVKNAYDNYYLAIPFLKMLKSGEIDEKEVDDKVRRILRLMYRTNMMANRPFGSQNSAEHSQVAYDVASEGIVLLKNEEQFFPIDHSKELTIAVIGQNAVNSMTIGGGSSTLKARYEISPLEGIQNEFPNATINYSQGYAYGPSSYGREIGTNLDSDSLKNEAINTAKNADMVLFIGGLNKNHFQDCEGGDRKHLKLPYQQDELIAEIQKVNQNIGVILISGNAVSMPWVNEVKGIVQTWYLGSEAGNALADVLSGDVNPSGKLPFTFPVKLEDNSAHYFGELSYPGDSINQYYKDDILVGYRWHETKKIDPLFAFGYGLSYTNFQLKDFKTDKKEYQEGETINITCQIENIGLEEGAEVIQVYVGKPKSKVERALKELKAFEKVELNKGEAQFVSLSIEVDKLVFYDESISDWNLEKGKYILYLGTASNQIIEELKITIN